MKYKVGDKVRIRQDLVDDKFYGTWMFSPDMREYIGRVATVAIVCANKSYILAEFGWWHWTDKMLEEVDEMKETGIAIVVDGNKTVASMDGKFGEARCSPDDKFDIFVGAKLALERLEAKCKPYSWLKDGVKYYYPCVGMNDLYDCCTYTNDPYHKRMINRGLVFKTKEEAVAAAKKMLAVLKEDEDDDC